MLVMLAVLGVATLWIYNGQDVHPYSTLIPSEGRSIVMPPRGGPGQCSVMPKGPQCDESPLPLFELEKMP
jgi:hypothetical protein